MSRPGDSEAGGVADLQTDVMRFMAILAICLVAIFALVQSIPLDTVPAEPTATPQAESEPVPTPVPDPVPEPIPEPVAEPIPELVAEPIPAAVEARTPAAPTQVPTPREGFTLQFETDLALTRLTARNEVALYAIGREKSLRMSVNRGRLSFWPASTPNQFFEMETSTVPDDVVQAYLRTAPGNTDEVQWGVTLPPSLQEKLNGFLESADGGALLISADGRLRLEP
jgi:hypothetical protein